MGGCGCGRGAWCTQLRGYSGLSVPVSSASPACALEKPSLSARCPLCAQDFRGTALPVTCYNFQPIERGKPQRGEAHALSRPFPPFSCLLQGLARAGPNCSRRAGRPPFPRGSLGWPRRLKPALRAYQPTRRCQFFHDCYLSAWGACAAWSQGRWQYSGTPSHSEIDDRAHRDTHRQAHCTPTYMLRLIRNHSHRHSDTPIQRTNERAGTEADWHKVTPVQHKRHGQEQTRSTRKHKDTDIQTKKVNK